MKLYAEQIIEILIEAKRSSIKKAAAKHNISRQTIYNWKKIYGCMEMKKVRQIRNLREENTRLKRTITYQAARIQILQKAIQRFYKPEDKTANDSIESELLISDYSAILADIESTNASNRNGVNTRIQTPFRREIFQNLPADRTRRIDSSATLSNRKLLRRSASRTRLPSDRGLNLPKRLLMLRHD